MPPPEPDLISVVIPTHNRHNVLGAAIASVRQQTWPHVELIVVDDASSDRTPELLKTLTGTDPGVRVIRNDVARGGAGARNQGLAAATGRWIAFLDDDDMWLPAKLATQVAALKANPAASAAACAFFYRAPFRRERILRPPIAPTTQQMLSDNPLGGASVCFASTQALRTMGGFDATLRSGQDWDLWLRLFLAGPIVVCDEPLVRYESHLGPRITNDIAAVYAGRRRIYFRYRHLMVAQTRERAVALLIYCRACATGVSARRRLQSLLKISRLVSFRRTLIYLLWFARTRLVSKRREA